MRFTFHLSKSRVRYPTKESDWCKRALFKIEADLPRAAWDLFNAADRGVPDGRWVRCLDECGKEVGRQEKNKNALYITYEEYCVDSEETAGGYRSFAHESYVSGVYKSPPENSWLWEKVVVNPRNEMPDQVYVVWVVYSTGDTFSSTSGKLAIAGAFETIEEADHVVDQIDNDKYPDYAPWKGYFESVSAVGRDLFTIREREEKRVIRK